MIRRTDTTGLGTDLEKLDLNGMKPNRILETIYKLIFQPKY